MLELCSFAISYLNLVLLGLDLVGNIFKMKQFQKVLIFRDLYLKKDMSDQCGTRNGLSALTMAVFEYPVLVLKYSGTA